MFGKAFPDLLLNIGCPVHHAVIFKRTEAVGRHEIQLGQQVGAGRFSEHAEMRGIAQGKIIFFRYLILAQGSKGYAADS
ncbi:hypothetical protein FQZ97_1024430 [compost metagenome]